MSGDDSTRSTEDGEEWKLPDPLAGLEPLTGDEFRASFGEDLCHTLDIGTWSPGVALVETYRRIREEVRRAVAEETQLQEQVREQVFKYLPHAPGSPPGAGCYSVTEKEIELLHKELIFAGGVEACDGTVEVTDSLPLTIYHIGVGLVSYQGNQGSWSQRLFRKDLKRNNGDVVGDALAALQRRSRRSGYNHEDDPLSELARRTIMSYAERAVLLRHARTPWRMGQGSVAPLEMLIGGGSADMMIESVKVIRDLVLNHEKFVFVASEPGDRLIRTIGGALRPMEYAIVGWLDERLEGRLRKARYSRPASVDARWDGKVLTPNQWLLRFRDEVARQVVVGVYRATRLASPQIFYAHVKHAEVAAKIALADSVLDEMRGFPMLIVLADRMCQSECTGASLRTLVESAYVEAGVPYQFFSEHMSRDRR